ncbi:MAG: FkbM family methyltransferase [Desulfobacteraceae bacterium]|nr:FkbM family methyltransferase [Desulfobacteraceae bacterium]
MNVKDLIKVFKRSYHKNSSHPTVERELWERSYSDNASEEDIYYCFRLLLGRNPHPKEWSGHRKEAGKKLIEVVSKFLSSNEFITYKQPDLVQRPVFADTQHETVELDDFKLCLSKTDNVCGSVLETKEYEPPVTAVLKKILAPGMVFLDIGANVGFFTCLAASIVGGSGKVFSFEPYEYNIKLLYMNTRLNGFKNVEIFPFAVSDRRTFFSYDDSAGNSGAIFDSNTSVLELLSSTLVYSMVLDDVLEPYPDKIDAIKIDIEGAEYLAFKGMKNRLKKDRPIIVSEFSPSFLQSISKKTAEEYLQILLIDENYLLAVIAGENNIIDCGRNMEQVIDCFNEAPGDHIDIIAYPKDKISVTGNRISAAKSTR